MTPRCVHVLALAVWALIPPFASAAAQQTENGLTLFHTGKQLYDNARYKEAIDPLEQALTRNLSVDEVVQARLFLAIANFALERQYQAEIHLRLLLAKNPQFDISVSRFPRDFVRLFEDVKAKSPVVYNVSVTPERFYPYRGEQPAIQLSVSYEDTVGWQIRQSETTVDSGSIHISSSDPTSFHWRWSEHLLLGESVEVRIRPSRNTEVGSYTGKLRLDIVMPDLLVYDGEFKLKSAVYLPETRTIERFAAGPCVGAVLVGTGFTGLFHKELSWAKAALIGYGVSWSAILKGCRAREKQLPVLENIERNRQRRAEVEAAKRDIAVTQHLVGR